jgi:hypothetical protein
MESGFAERELDERGSVDWVCRIGRDPANLPLNKQLMIDRAGAVAIKTVMERVIELNQREFFAAARIGAVQERAMIAGLRGGHRSVIGGLGRAALKRPRSKKRQARNAITCSRFDGYSGLGRAAFLIQKLQS